jgi:precorrin-6B methylase 1
VTEAAEKPTSLAKGSLTVVGTGIKLVSQTTLEARAHIQQAHKVPFLVADPATKAWIRQLNPAAESMDVYFSEGKPRAESFEQVIERIIYWVCEGFRVCAVFYGHPGVFVYVSHEAIRRAREMGCEAAMLPGISAEDCLIADLGVDMAAAGYQCFESSYFLIYGRKPDTSNSLILWQVGAIGRCDYQSFGDPTPGLRLITEVLLEHYPPDHEVTVYEAAQFPVCDPVIRKTALKDLPTCPVSRISTLYVPPEHALTPDESMLKRLLAIS